jgi:hypothetical protein
MNYWITSHWPSRNEDNDSEPDYDIWVPVKRKRAADDMRSGDKVAIYELKTARVEIQDKTGRRKSGLERIFCHGIVDIDDKPTPDTYLKKYKDGSKIRWQWVGTVTKPSTKGFVAKKELLKILGFKPTYTFHGFGNYSSGLKKITEDEFNSIIDAFKRNAK